MTNYDFAACLSSLDFELLSKDLLEAELGIQLENFREGRDKGIDLRFAPAKGATHAVFNLANFGAAEKPPELIVQCKRYSKFSDLKSVLKKKELEKIKKLNPARYILTTSVKLSPDQSEELQLLLSPFILSTGDIFGRDRLNSLLTNHNEIERRHLKLWVSSVGVLDSILNAGTHLISQEEVERTFRAAKLYVRNKSFDEALTLLEKQRICIISGLPGIGKTTLARMLLLYFYRRKYDIIKIASDVSEANKVGYHNKPRFYYYDDFLGQTAQADKLNKNEDQKLIDFMDSIRASKNSVFVLTTREYILNQAKLHYEKLARVNFDHRTCIIDLSKYSRRIRAQILYNHLHFSELTKEHVKSLTTKRGYLSIVDHKNYNPRLIEFLTDMDWVGNTAPKEYLALFLKKLDNPVDIWEHAFRNQLSEKAKNLLFILTTMPLETRIIDVEKAFRAFHSLKCSKYSITHSESDFQKALKELDGTFTATRRVSDCILVRFQNPSIRDFMQYLLLGGESLSDVITSLVFFEQAQWLVARLNEEASQLPMDALILHAASIIQALRKLIDTPSCTVLTYSPYLHVETSDSISRLATIVSAAQKHMHREDSEWVEGQIAELSKRLAAGQIYPSSIIKSMKPLQEYGYLGTSSGMELVSKLKTKAMCEPCDLDEFETLANLVDITPQSFKEEEIDSIRDEYINFADQYAADCDLSDPDELRGEARRIEEVGGLLEVDTESAQEALRATADEIEESQSQEPDDDDDRDRGSNHHTDECSDEEIDSMFSTLDG